MPPSGQLSKEVSEALAAYQLLKKEWDKSSPNLNLCGDLLLKLKILLTATAFMPTQDNINKTELMLARDTLEIGALWSVAKKDIPSFARYLAQLKCYYFDYQSVADFLATHRPVSHFRNVLPESAYKHQLLGLNLLSLLSQNRVAEFHTELELLPPEEIKNNIYIRHPVSLEQYLMEGSYNKVFLSKGNVPAESYTFFIDILLDTVREEIGACIEQAYDKMSIREAGRMLFFDNQQQLAEFVKKRKWTLLNNGTFVRFTGTGPSQALAAGHAIPAEKLASNAIEYARELEMIV